MLSYTNRDRFDMSNYFMFLNIEQDDSSVQDLRPPPDLLTGSEDISKVRKLNVFESCTLQIGDKYYMTGLGTDLISSVSFFF